MASIIKRDKKYIVIENYSDASGKRKQRWTTFDTKKEALEYKSRVDFTKSVGMPLFYTEVKTVEDLMKEYVDNYGSEKWSFSNYEGNTALIKNYILPNIGKMKLKDLSPRVIEAYYQNLLTQESVQSRKDRSKGQKKERQLVTTGTVRRIHKLLHSAFRQAERWEILPSNPFDKVYAPKHKEANRDIWELDDLKKALDVCTDPILELCINLAFSCSLRLGEVLGLTWDCVHISDDLISSNSAWIYVNKQLQRVSLTALEKLSGNEIYLRFPKANTHVTTTLVLKEPKTASSVRKIFLPRTVALMLKERKRTIHYFKDYLGSDYNDYNLVICYENGTPIEGDKIRESLNKLIKDNDLRPVVFHSLRHSSTTYKLKISGGDIKAVQGDTGHAEAAMITERYAHILDDDRRINAEKFEEMFYQNHGENLSGGNSDELLNIMKKLQESPELLELLKSLMK